MTGTIFDLVEVDLPEGQKGFMEAAARAPKPTDSSWLTKVNDYGKTATKGFVEGVSRLGRIMGPLQDNRRRSESEINQEQTESLDKLIPNENEADFGQKGLRRGLQQLPTAAAFPGATAGGTAARAIGAGYAGEGVKELGAPEWAQTAAELTAYIGPDITKKLLEKGSNAEIIKAARGLGISDEALTPLLQSETKQQWLSKIAPRRGGTKSALENSKNELQQAYGKTQESFAAQHKLPQQSVNKLIDTVEDKLLNMPSGVREKITTDFHDLLNGPVTGKTLINFYSDINHAMGKDSKQLSLLKEPIKNVLKEISPTLAKDFDTVNSLYTKYYPIASKLKPNIASDIIGAAEVITAGHAAYYALFGQFLPLAAVVGEKTARGIAQQMLINPRLQQFSQKMVVALNQNKFGLAEKIAKEFKNELRKKSPEFSDKIEDLSLEDFQKLTKSQQ